MHFKTSIGEFASSGGVVTEVMEVIDLGDVDWCGSIGAGSPTSASLDNTSATPSLSTSGKLRAVEAVEAVDALVSAGVPVQSNVNPNVDVVTEDGSV